MSEKLPDLYLLVKRLENGALSHLPWSIDGSSAGAPTAAKEAFASQVVASAEWEPGERTPARISLLAVDIPGGLPALPTVAPKVAGSFKKPPEWLDYDERFAAVLLDHEAWIVRETIADHAVQAGIASAPAAR